MLALVLVTIAATGGATWAASAGDSPRTPAHDAAAPTQSGPLVVPDVRSMPFVFAKETLEDAGFTWLVTGPVHGYASNSVVAQTPAPGTRLVFDGSPRIVLTLKRTPGYRETGEPQDASPNWGARAIVAGSHG